jgi:hypothetical protein
MVSFFSHEALTAKHSRRRFGTVLGSVPCVLIYLLLSTSPIHPYFANGSLTLPAGGRRR